MKTNIIKKMRLWFPFACIAIMLSACSSDDSSTVPAPEPEVKTLFYTATVGDVTRATLPSEESRVLQFATGDKLYVEGTNISGVLDIQSGVGTANGTFSGTLTYTGDYPSSSLVLSATLVGTEDNCALITDGKVTGVNYGTNIFPRSSMTIKGAVEGYSYITGTSTFGQRSFSLTQQTAFLNFTIKLTGVSSGVSCPVAVAGVGGSTRSGNVTSETSGSDVVVKFLVPVLSQTLNGATVKVNNYNMPFGGTKSVSGKVYNISKTVSVSYEYVDLGLPSGTKWAKTNLGAATETEYGKYYAWGGTMGHILTDSYTFTQDNAPFWNGSAYIKYNTTEETPLVSTDDAATVSRGSGWRMPTKAEFEELLANTTVVYKQEYQGVFVRGYLFTSTVEGFTDKSIYLPATGRKTDQTPSSTATGENHDGSYWLSTHHTTVDAAWSIGFSEFYDSHNLPESNGLKRYYGMTIRPVYKP